MVTRRIQRLTTRALDWGLLPLSIAVSLCALPVAVIMGGSHVSVPVAATAGVTIAAWYAGMLVRKPKHHPPDVEAEDDLEQRIKFVLTECRVVLPGVQATLGFLFADVFVESFAKLPRTSQITHVTSLILVLIATIILMAPGRLPSPRNAWGARRIRPHSGLSLAGGSDGLPRAGDGCGIVRSAANADQQIYSVRNGRNRLRAALLCPVVRFQHIRATAGTR